MQLYKLVVCVSLLLRSADLRSCQNLKVKVTAVKLTFATMMKFIDYIYYKLLICLC